MDGRWLILAVGQYRVAVVSLGNEGNGVRSLSVIQRDADFKILVLEGA